MTPAKTKPIVIFAQVPPPEHGQSRMVRLALESLRAEASTFDVYHVNARFSETLEDIGESSFRKAIPIAKYLLHAIRIRFSLEDPLLYYVPGPAKWSAILRDWVLLAILRMFYPRVVFHWHAIGHGEWAEGSARLSLAGPRLLERMARKISGIVLARPYASIAVCSTTGTDSRAVGSRHEYVVCNGIEDPCVDFEDSVKLTRHGRYHEIAHSPSPCFRILFLSHGTVEKGLLDALDSIRLLLGNSDPLWKFSLTIAGGVSEGLKTNFEKEINSLKERYADRLQIAILDYVTGSEKQQCFLRNEIFLAPSRWESFGLTVVEAMASGLLVVAAASDGVSGVLPDGYPYLSPVADPQTLSSNLQRCCATIHSNPEAAIAQTVLLRRRFQSSFQLHAFSKNLVEVIKDLGAPKTGASCGNSCSGSKAYQTTAHARILSHPAKPALASTISLSVYLADQNPGHDRSFGISRMSHAVLDALIKSGRVTLETVVSQTSQQSPQGTCKTLTLPWGTRRKTVRLLTDHLHPFFTKTSEEDTIYYFPKGYLPISDIWCKPSVVTIHDTIIQYDEDHYPQWRKRWQYAYWSLMLKHTLRNADRIMTVSESSKKQILSFMERHAIRSKEITVTYEPCLYEAIPQPITPVKGDYVIHLASCEPHKRTAHLIRWWHEAESQGRNLPMLQLIGTIPSEVEPLLASSHSIVKSPFLEETALQAAYLSAKALILPSEIEGFGLPALEAYYLGTPVCFVKGTSVEEILSVATNKGEFDLVESSSLFQALGEVLAMSPEEVRQCGLKLRETYASEKVAARMMEAFRGVASGL